MGKSEIGYSTDTLRVTRIPSSNEEALRFLRPWLSSDAITCQVATNEEILVGWHALQYLFAGLNPDDGYKFGDTLVPWPEGRELFPEIASTDCFYDLDSGWPICFRELLQEMWRRYERKKVKDGEMYCLFALKSGVFARNRRVTLKQRGGTENEMDF